MSEAQNRGWYDTDDPCPVGSAAMHALTVVALLVLLAPAAAAASPPAVGYAAPARLTVVTDVNYPPYLFQSADGQLQGILSEKWALWSRSTGVPVQLIGMDWAQAQASVENGSHDVIEVLTYTPGRAALYEFSPPYSPVEARVYFHRTISGISNDVATMRGFTIGAKAGSACGSWLGERAVEVEESFATSEALVRAASAAEVRLFCMDAPAARYFLFKHRLADEFRETPPLYVTEFHWAVRKGRAELRDFIQRGFDGIAPDEIEAIKARWLGNPLRFPIATRYLYYLGFAALAVIGAGTLLVLWNRTLRRRVAARTAELSAAITEQRRSTERLRATLDNTPGVAVQWFDRSGRVLYWNPASEKLYGITAADAAGKTMDALIHTPEQYHAFLALIAAMERTGEPCGPLEITIRGRHGTEVAVLYTMFMIPGQGAEPVFVCMDVDISERKRAEHRVQEYVERLQALSRRLLEAQEAERRTVARELHDEVGQQLTAVLVTLHALKSMTTDGGFAGRLEEGARFVDRVIDEIRNTSLRLRPTVLDDLGLIPALRWLVGQQHAATNMDIGLEIAALSSDIPPETATACFRIVQESITNAVRHARASRVRVRIAESAGRLDFEVEDDGAGFDPEQARVKSSEGRSSGLTGARERAELLGGTLDVRATPGRGTVVHASLPLAEPGTRQAPSDAVAA